MALIDKKEKEVSHGKVVVETHQESKNGYNPSTHEHDMPGVKTHYEVKGFCNTGGYRGPVYHSSATIENLGVIISKAVAEIDRVANAKPVEDPAQAILERLGFS